MARRPSVTELIASHQVAARKARKDEVKSKQAELEMARELFLPLLDAARDLQKEFRSAGHKVQLEEEDPYFGLLGDSKSGCEYGLSMYLDSDPVKVFLRVSSTCHRNHRYSTSWPTEPFYTMLKYRERRVSVEGERPYPDAIERVTDFRSPESAIDAVAHRIAEQISSKPPSEVVPLVSEERFLARQEWYLATLPALRLSNDIQSFRQFGNVDVSINWVASKPKFIELQNMERRPGESPNGSGTGALKMVKLICDQYGLSIYGSALCYDPKNPSWVPSHEEQEHRVSWYRRHGFEIGAGDPPSILYPPSITRDLSA